MAKGAAGDRLARSSIKSLAARWTSSAEDVWGMAKLLGGEMDVLGNAFGGRERYVDAVSAIVLRGCANVPAVNAVTGPGAADGRSRLSVVFVW